jgi:hypothetical protein
MEYYYSSDGEKNGPVSLEQLKKLAGNGEINRYKTQVWSSGMKDWVPSGEVEGIFTSPPPPELPRIKRISTNNVQKFNTNLYLWTILPSMVLALIPSRISLYAMYDGCYGCDKISAIASAISIIPMIVMVVFMALFIHKKWTLLIQTKGYEWKDITPNKALWYLIIPFFGFYWLFRCFVSWSDRANQIAGDIAIPRGIVIAYCVVSLSGIVISYVPVLAEISSIALLVLLLIYIRKVGSFLNQAEYC